MSGLRRKFYYKVRGRYLTYAQARRLRQLQKRRYSLKPKPRNLTLVFVNIHQEKPKTGTLLDYMT